MKARLSQRFCQLLCQTSAVCLSLAAFFSAPVLRADDFDCGYFAEAYVSDQPETGEIVPTEMDHREEWCGWGTHDSGPVPHPRIASRTSSTFDRSIAAAASTACASAGISVEQIIEPFAMVGPAVSDSLQRVREFSDWWNKSVAEHDSSASESLSPTASVMDKRVSEAADIDDDLWEEFGESVVVERGKWEPVVDCRIEQLLLEEPIDVQTFGLSVPIIDEAGVDGPPSVTAEDFAKQDYLDLDELLSMFDELLNLVEQVELVDEVELVDGGEIDDADEILETDKIGNASETQVGASPMIVSIEDTYLPYDLSVRDLKVWSVFPLVTEPFCVRSHRESITDCYPWNDTDVADVAAGAVSAESERTMVTTAEAAEAEADVTVIADQDATGIADQFAWVEGSAACLLDEWAWHVNQFIDEHPSLQAQTRPVTLGRWIATLARTANRIADFATERVATIWPESAPAANVADKTAGEKLLARAGAIDAAEPNESISEPTDSPLDDTTEIAADVAEVSNSVIR